MLMNNQPIISHSEGEVIKCTVNERRKSVWLSQLILSSVCFYVKFISNFIQMRRV